MIGRLTGTIVEKDLKGVILDVGGVGYDVLLPLGDLTRVGQLGERVTLRIHTHVREDALQLFGFLTDDGKAAFNTLLSVNGVGPKMALGILSGIDPGELSAAVQQKDLARLTAIPGVGKKTAERLCLELAGKLGPVVAVHAGPPTASQVLSDLKSALDNLGYKGAQIDKVVKALETPARDGATMEVLVRDALRMLARGEA
ncbi:MAG: Holliday junction branch migration protein RuvA [Myxococcota bacterium]